MEGAGSARMMNFALPYMPGAVCVVALKFIWYIPYLAKVHVYGSIPGKQPGTYHPRHVWRRTNLVPLHVKCHMSETEATNLFDKVLRSLPFK